LESRGSGEGCRYVAEGRLKNAVIVNDGVHFSNVGIIERRRVLQKRASGIFD